MATIVISLGGSLVVPHEVDCIFLKRFKAVIQKLRKKHKFVVVVGGGSTARKYINAVRKENPNPRYASLVGIETTHVNASLVAAYLRKFRLLPKSLIEVKSNLMSHGIVVCGALGFLPKMTSDGDAAMIADFLKADYFVNLTNVDGLYTKDPKKKGAKHIPVISFKDFKRKVDKIKYKAGQHFVLDQVAAKIITQSKIKTLILNGKNLKNFEKALEGKDFVGTTING